MGPITNSTSFALMPTNAIVNLEAPLYTTAEDIAAAVCYFASDEAGFVTGQVLTADGGFIL